MNPDFTVRSSSRVYIASAMELLPHLVDERRVVVITDATIDRLYGKLLAPYEKILIGRGETIKTLQTVEQIIRQLVALGADRKTLLLAVGQFLGEQHNNQTHQGRKDKTEDKGPAKADRATTTQHTDQSGQETATQQGKNQD